MRRRIRTIRRNPSSTAFAQVSGDVHDPDAGSRRIPQNRRRNPYDHRHPPSPGSSTSAGRRHRESCADFAKFCGAGRTDARTPSDLQDVPELAILRIVRILRLTASPSRSRESWPLSCLRIARDALRVMQTQGPPFLPLLRARPQAELLTLVVLNPGREWTLTELARPAGASVATAQPRSPLPNRLA